LNMSLARPNSEIEWKNVQATMVAAPYSQSLAQSTSLS
jgi:hypothetical protein